jgi:hypothetical protein
MRLNPIIAGPPGGMDRWFLDMELILGTIIAVIGFGLFAFWRFRQLEQRPPTDDRGRR